MVKFKGIYLKTHTHTHTHTYTHLTDVVKNPGRGGGQQGNGKKRGEFIKRTGAIWLHHFVYYINVCVCVLVMYVFVYVE